MTNADTTLAAEFTDKLMLWKRGVMGNQAFAEWVYGNGGAILAALTKPAVPDVREAEALDAIADMMGEFVENWPEPKRFDTALKLIAKTMRAALTQSPTRCPKCNGTSCPPNDCIGGPPVPTRRHRHQDFIAK